MKVNAPLLLQMKKIMMERRARSLPKDKVAPETAQMAEEICNRGQSPVKDRATAICQ